MGVPKPTTLDSTIAGAAFEGALSADLISAARADDGGDFAHLLLRLGPMAKRFAVVPTSNYRVGVAVLGASGRVYLGANVEFEAAPLYLAVHAEQAAVTVAKNHGEQRLEAMAVHTAPCGHCRQFLLELGEPDDLMIVTPNDDPRSLRSILPQPFGPKELGSDAVALGIAALPAEGRSLLGQAIAAAERSHAPYSRSRAGVALELDDGRIVVGSYIESVAYNPSLDPLRAACAAAAIQGWPAKSIVRIVLACDASGSVDHARAADACRSWLSRQPPLEIHDLGV